MIVRAKGDIASGLAARVESILLPGPVDPYYLGEARQALEQQLLVRLADAYTFDAVVQYPVAAKTPFSSTWSGSVGLTGPVPPRFSGSLDTDLYVSTENATFGDVAAQLGVSASFLCWAVRDTRGLLRSKVSIPACASSRRRHARPPAAFFGVTDRRRGLVARPATSAVHVPPSRAAELPTR